MANTYSIPPKMPAQADYAAGQAFRARLMDAIGKTQNASFGLAMRGGVSQGWPDTVATTGGAGYSTAFTWRIPTWPGTTGLTIGMRHAASVGTYGFRLSGAGAPAATAFGAGVPSMLWNMQGYTRTTFAMTHESTNGYRDVDLLLNNLADLYRISIMMDRTSTTLGTSAYADGYTPFGDAAATEAGHAGLYHLGVDNLDTLSVMPRCWHAWSAPSSNVSGYSDPIPRLSFPVWVPRGAERARQVKVHANVIMDGGGPTTSRADFYFGNTPVGSAAPLRFGRFVGSTVSTNVAGEWDDFSFFIRPDEYLCDGILGGWVNIAVDPVIASPSVVDGTLAAVSVWVE